MVTVGLTSPKIQTRQSPPAEDVTTEPISVRDSLVFHAGLLAVRSPSEPMASIRSLVLALTVCEKLTLPGAAEVDQGVTVAPRVTAILIYPPQLLAASEGVYPSWPLS